MQKQGRIASFMYGDEPLGPPRVWLKDVNVPGLCMTRSFGDCVAASVGVIDVPEVVACSLKPEDRWVPVNKQLKVSCKGLHCAVIQMVQDLPTVTCCACKCWHYNFVHSVAWPPFAC